VDPELFERLRSWRSEQARRQQVPAYVVLHNSHLEEISTHKPHTIQELGAIKGIGLRRAARYGDDLLALIHGEQVTAGDEAGGTNETAGTEDAAGTDAAGDAGEVTGANGFRVHLESAERLLGEGRGADAVPELGRALELGGEEARREVDELLKLTAQ
jgi:hypothetical protein